MKKNSSAALLVFLTAMFQLVAFFWGNIVPLQPEAHIAAIYNEIGQAVHSKLFITSMILNFFFAFALADYDKPTKGGHPYILKDLIVWAVLSMRVSQILTMLFVLPNIIKKTRYVSINANWPAIREKINPKCRLIGTISAVVCVALLILSVAQLPSTEVSLLFAMSPKLIVLIPAFLISIAEIHLCEWATTDPYGIYTSQETSGETSVDDDEDDD